MTIRTSMTKTFPEVVIDRQGGNITFDGEELPYFFAEAGPRVEELGEGLSVLWLPIIVGDVEEIPATPAPDVVARGGRVLESYRGDS